MAEHHACLASEVKAGSALRVDLPLADGTKAPIAIVRTDDGRYFAVDDTCSHGQVSLSEGEIEGNDIECWGHGGRFDLETGRPTAIPAIAPIRSYPIRVEGENVLVDVDAPKSPAKEDA